MQFKIFVNKGIGPQLIAECIDREAAADFAGVYAHNHHMGWMWSRSMKDNIVILPGFTSGKPHIRGGRV